ncbi:MAG: CvpA family protein [Hyphomicrobiaceae bacterium]|nr:CvpA family protein [Hyphomicrobiaceae bacterium]
MIGPLSYLDAGLLAICFISGLLAMYRGLTREMLSILSWIVAAAATLYFVLNHKAFATEMAQQMGTQVAIAQIAVGAIIFLIVLIVVHLITARISDSVLDSQVGMIDRFLGFLFGVARGFILVVIPYMLYEAFVVDPKKPESEWAWVRQSQSLPYIQSAGGSIRSILMRYIPSSLTAPPSGDQQQGALPGTRENVTFVTLVFRLRHLVPLAAPDRPSVGDKGNTSNSMILVLLSSPTLGKPPCSNRGPSVSDATLAFAPVFHICVTRRHDALDVACIGAEDTARSKPSSV